MTSDELAYMGYQPGQQPTLFVPDQDFKVSQQDLQQFQNNGGQQINSQDLAQATPNPGENISSDPNGLISNQPYQVDGPDGSPMVLPPNTEEKNAFGGQPAPQQPDLGKFDPTSENQPDQQPTQIPNDQTSSGDQNNQISPAPTSTVQAPPQQFTPWQQYLTERGIGPRSVVDLATHRELIKGFNQLQIKQLEMQDPAKKLDAQIKQHQIDTQQLDDQVKAADAAQKQSSVVASELAKGKALQDASNQVAALETQRDNLQAIANHPELKYVVGNGRFLPALSDGQRDLKARLAQVSGQNLISGINMIKDEASTPGSSLGFRITQQEAQAVKDAVNRLQTYQDPETFKNSVNEYVGILNKAIDAKTAQIAKMPSVNENLLKQFSYNPATAPAATGSGSPAASASSTRSATAVAPQLRTVGGKTYQLNPATGGWRPIN